MHPVTSGAPRYVAKSIFGLIRTAFSVQSAISRLYLLFCETFTPLGCECMFCIFRTFVIQNGMIFAGTQSVKLPKHFICGCSMRIQTIPDVSGPAKIFAPMKDSGIPEAGKRAVIAGRV